MAGHADPAPGFGRAGPGARSASGRRRPSASAVAATLGVAAYGAVAGRFPSFSLAATVAVLAPGVALAGYAVATGPRFPLRPARRLTRRGALLWAVPVLGFSGLEIVNDLLGSTPEHPTLSVLADPLLASHTGRAVAMAAWLAAGLALARL